MFGKRRKTAAEFQLFLFVFFCLLSGCRDQQNAPVSHCVFVATMIFNHQEIKIIMIFLIDFFLGCFYTITIYALDTRIYNHIRHTYICGIHFFLGFLGTAFVKISAVSPKAQTLLVFAWLSFVVVVILKPIRPPPGAEQLTVSVGMNLRGKAIDPAPQDGQ